MNLRLMFIVVGLLIGPIICADTAYADAVTLAGDYQELGEKEKEKMTWKFRCAQKVDGVTLAGCSGSPSGQKAWKSEVTFDGPRLLRFKLSHIEGPHGTVKEIIDINPGEEVEFAIQTDFSFRAGQWTELKFTSGKHFTTIPPKVDHTDFYRLFVTVDDKANFVFFLTAGHCSAAGGNALEALEEPCPLEDPPEIPEPTTMLLLGTGLVGVAMKMRKKLKSRKSAGQ